MPVAGRYADIVDAFEQAVPSLDADDLVRTVRKHSDWDTVETWTIRHAPHGFLRYWRNDPTALMAISGNTASCVSYLMGNHVVAERMFRRDPRVMGLAPLRVTISQRMGEPVLFTSDVPSASFASFGDDHITAVAHGLDRKLAELLVLLGIAVPEVLAAL
ncbi:hypothetical protein BIU96_04905 [Curtobacterium sp. MCBA15_008]|nr:hypothetical protein BIU96_04905 [Curtobacterium sp. MCBA15_008]